MAHSLVLAAAALCRVAAPRCAVPRAVRVQHIRCLNRLLLEPNECKLTHDGCVIALLPHDDTRVEHVRNVLRAREGEGLRVGVLDGGACEASVAWVPAEDEDGPRNLRLTIGDVSVLRSIDEAHRPRIDLLLAMPRPLQFARLLPAVASLGVRHIWITGAARVEKSYFSSHLLRAEKAAELRATLVEGLAQAGDTAVPTLAVRRSLRSLLHELDDAVTDGEHPPARLVCHPQRIGATEMVHISRALVRPGARVLLAIGPEGGWDEPEELELLAAHGFQPVTLGPRTLRTDVAVISLMAIVHASLAHAESGDEVDSASLTARGVIKGLAEQA